MKRTIETIVFEAIPVDENYLGNMLKIHKILDDLEKHKLMLTKNGIVKPIIPKKEESKHARKNSR